MHYKHEHAQLCANAENMGGNQGTECGKHVRSAYLNALKQ